VCLLERRDNQTLLRKKEEKQGCVGTTRFHALAKGRLVYQHENCMRNNVPIPSLNYMELYEKQIFSVSRFVVTILLLENRYRAFFPISSPLYSVRFDRIV
jgi:hypothetical protein